MAYSKKNYVLDNVSEFERLEDQVTQKNYSLKEELRFLEIKGGQRILDAGCGSGVLSKFLVSKNIPITVDACDYSELRIKQAKQYNKALPQINYHVSDLNRLPFEDETFDTVFSRFVFEYLDDPIKVA